MWGISWAGQGGRVKTKRRKEERFVAKCLTLWEKKGNPKEDEAFASSWTRGGKNFA